MENSLVQFNSYDADYGDGRGPLTGVARHAQVYAVGGFTCDKGISCLVRAFWDAGMETHGGCENSNVGEGFRSWYVPRGKIIFSSPKGVYHLLDFCLFLKTNMRDGGWSQQLVLDNHAIPNDPFAQITFTWKAQQELTEVVRALTRRMRYGDSARIRT